MCTAIWVFISVNKPFAASFYVGRRKLCGQTEWTVYRDVCEIFHPEKGQKVISIKQFFSIARFCWRASMSATSVHEYLNVKSNAIYKIKLLNNSFIHREPRCGRSDEEKLLRSHCSIKFPVILINQYCLGVCDMTCWHLQSEIKSRVSKWLSVGNRFKSLSS